jgi:hypothetical protein
MAETNKPIPSLIIGLGGTGALTIRHLKEQMLNIYDNETPDEVGMLVIDTSRKPLAQFNQGVVTREAGMGYGAIDLQPNEIIHIGGDAKRLLENTHRRQPGTDHLQNWLDAGYYRRQDDSLMKIENGAGQYRQIGRLAFFMDVATQNTSSLYRRINERIRALGSKLKADRSLQVFVVGSLTGGTGAGLFIDVVNLVHRIASSGSTKVPVQARGYFFLPDAFGATLNNTEINDAYPRSYAALRELSRFVLHEDIDLGYPMYYHPSTNQDNQGLWRNRVTDKIFNLIYLVDGTRKQNPLRNFPIGKGATPSVADAILSMIDSSAGEYHNSYNSNLNTKITRQRENQEYVPYVGGVGTYTILLPIQQMIDGWAFKLGIQALEHLLQPTDRKSVV